ncbi:probable protein arginine N-methyltransferase 6.2 isoform X4 [Phoenix dactylifera]|uniref:Probable protein arginine N-methyltransferase 6.2 isoform X4 n=1 Tax=Phoenix dactylifera TaxID=42345 RepID=A0A8B8ZJE2_PHODC|nr:probable protein arginine N-methyltransferase 6.2 isoform X4 [Phoenix dactylifera]
MLPRGPGFSNGHPPRPRRGRTRGLRDSYRGLLQQQQQQDWPSARPCTEFDKAYFHAYSHVGVHEEMIKDDVRTGTYKAAIMRYQNLIEGKVVLDVGCGTGILAIFCALAGAKRVYAVDASEIALQANEIVKDNNLSDKVIVMLGRVEDVNIEENVDVIISEWMGYMLLYETMLPSIIFARDKWLKPGGLILPSHATLYMAPVTHTARYSESIDFWRDVYGIKMSAMLPLAKQSAFEEPCIETITGENVLTWPLMVMEVDCYTIKVQELESITANYRFSSMLNGSPSSDQHSQNSSQSKKRVKSDETIVLSTAPEDAPTHWQQTLLYLYEPIELKQDQIIEGSVTLTQSMENPRFLNIHLAYSSGGRSFVKESVMR